MIAGQVINLRASDDSREQLVLKTSVLEECGLARIQLRLKRVVDFGLRPCRHRIRNAQVLEIASKRLTGVRVISDSGEPPGLQLGGELSNGISRVERRYSSLRHQHVEHDNAASGIKMT